MVATSRWATKRAIGYPPGRRAGKARPRFP
jgi:hypothetical protein